MLKDDQDSMPQGTKVKTQHTQGVYATKKSRIGTALDRKILTQHRNSKASKPTFKLKIDKSVFVHE